MATLHIIRHHPWSNGITISSAQMYRLACFLRRDMAGPEITSASRSRKQRRAHWSDAAEATGRLACKIRWSSDLRYFSCVPRSSGCIEENIPVKEESDSPVNNSQIFIRRNTRTVIAHSPPLSQPQHVDKLDLPRTRKARRRRRRTAWPGRPLCSTRRCSERA